MDAVKRGKSDDHDCADGENELPPALEEVVTETGNASVHITGEGTASGNGDANEGKKAEEKTYSMEAIIQALNEVEGEGDTVRKVF